MSGPAKVRAFLFDMDGVLLDSNPLHRLAWEEYNRRQGVETADDMHRRMYGKRNDEIVRDLFGASLSDEEVFRYGAGKEALYREMMLPRMAAALVPGVREFLERHRDIPAAVATNAEPANVEFVLREADLGRYFAAAIDGHQVKKPKPDPEIYLRAAASLAVAPEYCVVFEDSYTGVRAGLAAGMRVIGVSTTHHDLPDISLLIGDFTDPELEVWLSERV